MQKRTCSKCQMVKITDNFIGSGSVCIDCEYKSFQDLGRLPDKISRNMVMETARKAGQLQAELDLLGGNSNYCLTCSNRLKSSNDLYCSVCKKYYD